jgi:hypothetical protein
MMEDLLFDVEKLPVTELGVTLPTLSSISHAIVGNGKVLNFCSPDYELIPNQQIVDDFREYLESEGVEYRLHYQAYGNVRFKIMFYLPGFEFNLGSEEHPDLISPSIYIWNSYNGTLKYQFGVQAMRLICSNGLTAMVNLKHLKLLHTMGSANAVSQSLAMVKEFTKRLPEIIEPFEDLQQFPVKDVNSRIDTVIENTSYPIWLGEVAKDRAAKEIQDYGVLPTDWLIYNSLNYALNHNADHLVGRKADALDREVLEFLLEG